MMMLMDTCPDCGGEITRQPGAAMDGGAPRERGWCDDCGTEVHRRPGDPWERVRSAAGPWCW